MRGHGLPHLGLSLVASFLLLNLKAAAKTTGKNMPSFIVESVGMTAAALTTLCWVPQAVRIIRTRDTRALSLVTQAALAGGVALWLAYGCLLGSIPLVAANAVTLALVTAILIMKLRFG